MKQSLQTPMNAEEFKNAAAGCQSIATIIAIVTGGFWALFTFNKLGASTRAQAEIQALQQNALQQPNLFIHIDEKAIAGNHSEPKVALIKVTLRNDGKKALEYKNCEVVLSKILTSSNNPFGPAIANRATFVDDDGKRKDMPARVMRAGQSRTLAFAVLVDQPGSYRVEFSTVYSGMDLKDGDFTPSTDVNIASHEQSFMEIP
jgi:hypothetical protein